MFKKCAALLLSFLTVFISAVPSFAAPVQTNLMRFWDYNQQYNINLPYQGETKFFSSPRGNYIGFHNMVVFPELGHNYLGIYFSYYGYDTTVTHGAIPSGFESGWSSVLTNGQEVVCQSSATTFDVDLPSSEYIPLSGVNVKVKCELDDSLDGFTFQAVNAPPYVGYYREDRFSGSPYPTLILTAASIVYTQKPGDLAALENIADQLAANNALINQLYGDVMVALNAIFGVTQDISSTQDIALQYLSNIDSNVTALGAKLDSIKLAVDLVRTQISGDIAAQTAALIAKLDALMGEGSGGGLPGISDGLNDSIGQIGQQEQIWHDSMKSNFDALHFGDFAFDNRITGGFRYAGTLFTKLWNALGAWVVVYTFPLYLGIALLALGRLARARVGTNRGDKDG